MKKQPPETPAGFGALASALAKVGLEDKGTAPTAPKPAPPAGKPPVPPTKLQVRMEKKGRGGKTVTTVVGLPEKGRDAVVKALKTRLGTGASVDDDGTVVVQGDHVDRVKAALVAQGFKA